MADVLPGCFGHARCGDASRDHGGRGGTGIPPGQEPIPGSPGEAGFVDLSLVGVSSQDGPMTTRRRA